MLHRRSTSCVAERVSDVRERYYGHPAVANHRRLNGSDDHALHRNRNRLQTVYEVLGKDGKAVKIHIVVDAGGAVDITIERPESVPIKETLGAAPVEGTLEYADYKLKRVVASTRDETKTIRVVPKPQSIEPNICIDGLARHRVEDPQFMQTDAQMKKKAQAPIATTSDASSERICALCKKPLPSSSHRLRRYCGSEVCMKQRKKMVNQKYSKKLLEQRSSNSKKGDKNPLPTSHTTTTKPCLVCGDPMPKYSMYSVCAACRPGKDTQQEAPNPKAFKTPSASDFPKHIKSANLDKNVFDDPWDCAVCRGAGDLCTLHETMARDGKKPPRKYGY